tara:strand:+ start:8976 stop:9443 length:468 start_codon:yes stop_codon:yes gene_type:complete
MSTLSEKRKFYYEARHSHNETNLTLGAIDLNTDELETKLDTIIANTNHDTLVNGEFNFTLVGSATGETPAVNIGSQSGQYIFQWAGTETSTNLEYTIWTSTDNVTYYPLPSAVAVKTNGYISLQYDMVFQYHKLKIVNTHHSQSSSITLVYSGRH